MFNVLSQNALPGFRVRPQDDMPGFDVDESGLPRREAIWSDGMPPETTTPNPEMATPNMVTPVNCTMAKGRMGCMTDLGGKFDVEAPLSFPPRIGSGVEGSHAYSIPDGPVPLSDEELMQGVIDKPTPGPGDLVRPATPERTMNEATPEAAYRAELIRRGLPYGTLINPVRSYLTKDQWGNPIMVNVTQPGHTLFPGYVARYVTSSDKGSTIQNEGEGLAGLQGPYSQRLGLADLINNYAWRGRANEIMKGR
jgi:hypothetical protein